MQPQANSFEAANLAYRYALLHLQKCQKAGEKPREFHIFWSTPYGTELEEKGESRTILKILKDCSKLDPLLTAILMLIWELGPPFQKTVKLKSKPWNFSSGTSAKVHIYIWPSSTK
jgi:hypothetical protein